MAVVFQGTKDELNAKLQEVVDALSGAGSDASGIGQSVLIAMGMAALADITEAFVIKARGGTDAMGIQWEPLKPETVAARRVGPKDVKNDPAIKERERIRKREYRKAYKRFLMSLPPEAARQRAAMVAGIRATRETGKTKMETLGFRNVEILRDTGILLNSLSPGVISGSGLNVQYVKPMADGGDQQVFAAGGGVIIVGTNVPYAESHQEGDPSRNLPARPFMPPTADAIPDVWWQNWLDAGTRALEGGLEFYLSA